MHHHSRPRRAFLAAAAALLLADPPSTLAGPPPAAAVLAAIERRTGGRLGVAALDTGSGRRIDHRSGERFPLCSTFKLLLSAAVLARVDRGEERLERVLPYGEADLLEHAPVTRAHVKEGGMPVAGLCGAAMTYSDNTAANLLLRTVGGPEGLTRYLRSLGDPATRLDRNEPTLNSALPGDPRDTTTPAAMLADLRALLLGGALRPPSRRQLQDWLTANTTGAARLRAGLPPDWQAGDKTGTGAHGSVNDVAVLWPPRRPPLLVVAYQTGSAAPAADLEAALAEVGRVAVREF